MRRLVVVAAADDLAPIVYPGQGLAVCERDIEAHDAGSVFEPAVDQFEQRIASLARRGRKDYALRIPQLLISKGCARGGVEQIGLIHRFNDTVLDRLVEAKFG